MSKDKKQEIEIALGDHYEVEVVNGTAKVNYTDRNAFVENATAAGITQDEIKKVDHFKEGYLKAAAKAGAEKSESIMKEDESINKVIVNFPYSTSAKGNVDIVGNRSVTNTYDIPGVGKGESTKSTIRVNVTDPALKVSKGYIKSLEAAMTASLLG